MTRIKHGRDAGEAESRLVSERLLVATRAAGIGTWEWYVENDQLVWDDQMYKLHGLRKDDFHGAYDAWASSLAPEDLGRANAALRAALSGEREFNQDFRIIWPDGSIHFIQAVAQLFRDEERKPVRLVGLNYDITERKLAEAKLKLSERRLAEAQQLAHFGHWERSLENDEIIWSDEVFRILGIPVGKPLENTRSYIHPEDRQIHELARAEMLRGGTVETEYRIVRPEGEVRRLHLQTRVIRDESTLHRRVFGTVQDVTELKHAEEQLKATSEQLRALTARLQSAREEEAVRIAREIHDDLGSMLTSLRWNLQALSKTLTEPGTQNPNLKARVMDMLELSDMTISTVRRIASELRPTVLDVLGLAEAIQWQTSQFQDRTGIPVNLTSGLDDVNFTDDQSTAVFRILQESLTNVLRHSSATSVDITMREEAGRFELVIRDNGRGIKATERSGPSSLGLLGMRERAQLVGGTFEISSAGPDQGTTVTMRMPVAPSCDSEVVENGD